MKFKTGFVLGAAAGVWAARKAGELAGGPSKQLPFGSEEAGEKLRALSGLAKERLADIMDGPLGAKARDRVTELIGTSFGGSSSPSDRWRSASSEDPIDASARQS